MARVEGFEPNQSGQQPTNGGNAVPVGVWGDSDIGVGVSGTSGVVPAEGDIETPVAGVSGHSFDDPGVWGRSLKGEGVVGESLFNIGIRATSLGIRKIENPADPDFYTIEKASDGIWGVTGANDRKSEDYVNGVRVSGVRGISVGTGRGVTGVAVSEEGVVGDSQSGAGVKGSSTVGIGVHGTCSEGPSPGVQGQSTIGTGVKGISDTQFGVWGYVKGSDSPRSGMGVHRTSLFDSAGVFGLTHDSPRLGIGVHGASVFGLGVVGSSTNGVAVYGTADGPYGFAGMFFGKVLINGPLFKFGGGFQIDHPLDPERMTLTHSFVESSEMLNVYSGTITTDETGTAEVTLPAYFEALNHDYRYQLTIIGEFAQAIIGQEVRDNKFTIRTDRPQIKVSWQVSGVRRDRWAEAHRIEVETAKPEPGYLDPELWGAPPLRPVAERTRARIIEMLPVELRDRADALLQSGEVDQQEWSALIDEAHQASNARRLTEAKGREEEWRRVQELVRRGQNE